MARPKNVRQIPQVVAPYEIATYKDGIEIAKKDFEKFIQQDLTMLPSPSQYISANVFSTMKYYSERLNRGGEISYLMLKRTPEEIKAMFELFKYMVGEIQKQIPYTPTLLTFCQFIGMGKNTFRFNTQNGQNMDLYTEMSEYFEETMAQGIITGKTKEVSGIFLMKSLYGYRDGGEAQVQIMNVNAVDKSVEEILEDFLKSNPVT